MSLADELDAELARRPGPRCTMCLLVASLPADESAVLAPYLANPSASSAGIARVLARRGHAIRAETVRRHRAGECSGL